MKLKPSREAGQRTKNRLKENGPNFSLIDRSDVVIAFGGLPGILVESNKNEWLGWFPINEIIVD